mgnify:CR=1 FL=1|tara:strand:- start:77 stop:373 length:297 start_codon:yes stop_codon:yes gene_type:complete
MELKQAFVTYDDTVKGPGKKDVDPKNGTDFKLKELYKLLNCDHIEIVETKFNDIIIVLDENGKLLGKPKNTIATFMYKYGSSDPIVGAALICNRNQIQ